MLYYRYMDFVYRGILALVCYFFGEKLISLLVHNAEAQQLFTILLLVLCVAYILFGGHWFAFT